jgi:hypothetical protein
MIVHIEAEIKLLQLFKCKLCGKEMAGTTEHHTFKRVGYGGGGAIYQYLEDIRLNPHNMPVGWAHNGNGNFNCGCKE